MKAPRFSRSALVGVVFGLLSAGAFPGVADAAPSAQDRAAAKTAWNKGKKLASQKRYQDAIEALREADGLDPKTQYKLDLARAYADSGKLVEAAELCTTIQGMDEPNAKQQKGAAEKLAEKLAGRVPHIRVEVSAGRDAVAKIDGEEVPIGEDVAKDPGTHVVKAEAPGYRSVSKDVTIEEGAKKTVTLTLAAEVVMSKDAPEEKRSGGTMVPAGISFGVGATGIVVGTVFGILAFKATSDVQSRCKGNVCPPSEEGNIITAKTDGNVSTAGFVIGGVGLAAGIVLALTVGRGSHEPADKTEKAEKSAHIAPMAGPNGIGVMGAF